MNTAGDKLMASPPRDTHAEEVHVPLKTYYVIFAALMVLLFITIGAAFINFGHHTINITIALLIATLKAGLVVLYFMHVKYASRMTQIFVGAALLWLAILFILTFSDYVSRPTLPVSAGWTHNPVRQIEQQAAAESHSSDAPSHAPSHAK